MARRSAAAPRAVHARSGAPVAFPSLVRAALPALHGGGAAHTRDGPHRRGTAHDPLAAAPLGPERRRRCHVQ
eukprot:12516184-Alexandrium_andersonii.AAC.1